MRFMDEFDDWDGLHWGHHFSDAIQNVPHEDEMGFPPTKVYEDGDGYLFLFDVTGFQEEDLRFRFRQGILTVTGSRQGSEWEEIESAQYRSPTSFRKSFRFPVPVIAADIRNRYEQDFLILWIPKVKKAVNLGSANRGVQAMAEFENQVGLPR